MAGFCGSDISFCSLFYPGEKRRARSNDAALERELKFKVFGQIRVTAEIGFVGKENHDQFASVCLKAMSERKDFCLRLSDRRIEFSPCSLRHILDHHLQPTDVIGDVQYHRQILVGQTLGL